MENLNDTELGMLFENEFNWTVTLYSKRVGCDKKTAREKVLAVYYDLHGITPPTAKYVGYIEKEDLPFKAGDEVIIPKGVSVRTMEPKYSDGCKVAGRNHKVKIHRTAPGRAPYQSWDRARKQMHPTNPTIVWAGPGGYWCEVDVNDILEANGK